MKLGTLQLFAHVMEQGSFSKAAIAAFTTQSNISKQISSLEEEIGVRLFERNNQGVAPTPAAVCLSMGLKEQLPMMKRLLEQTRKAAEAENLSLKISISDSMSINHITPLLTAFRGSCPGVELKLIAQPQENILRRLAEGDADVALIYSVWPTDAACVTRKAITRTSPCIYYSNQEWPGAVTVDTFRDAAFVRLESSSIDAMQDLRQGIRLRAYAQTNPVDAYKAESLHMFEEMISAIQEETVRRLYSVRLKKNEEVKRERVATGITEGRGDGTVKKQPRRVQKIGRNDPCPCGSGKKYKHCCGRDV